MSIIHEVFCLICLKMFRGADRRTRICSRECNAIRQGKGRAIAEHSCGQCTKQFRPRANDRTIFCSRACAFGYKKDRAINRTVVKPQKIGQCARCSKEFVIKTTAKLCSQKCRYMFYQRKRCPSISLICKKCGAEFSKDTRIKARAFCSVICSRRYARQVSKRSRRQRCGPVRQRKRRRIFLRDKKKCQICNRHVRWADASIDHIMPVCLGGKNDDSNIQLAHLLCNIKKGGRVMGQLRIC